MRPGGLIMLDVSFSTRFVPGSLISGKYRLLHKLGEGAMGVVWAAMNEITVREVALKVIARPEPGLSRRLLREARACGALRHPNIVDIYDAAQTEAGELFLVMELLNGQSLAELLADKRRLDAPVAVRTARDVAAALAAAHARSIIHRDLKPANIFLHRASPRHDFVVKVVDFGVAKDLAHVDDDPTATGDVVGSPFYMSPEQIRGDRDLDPRADIWSLGVVLFEMLSGVLPFQGEGPALLANVRSGEVPKVSRYLWRADGALEAIIDGCLQRDPSRRPDAAALVAQLQSFLDGASNAPAVPASPAPALPPAGQGREPAASLLVPHTIKMGAEEHAAARQIAAAPPAPPALRGDRGRTASRPPIQRARSASHTGSGVWSAQVIAALVALLTAGVVVGVALTRRLARTSPLRTETSAVAAPMPVTSVAPPPSSSAPSPIDGPPATNHETGASSDPAPPTAAPLASVSAAPAQPAAPAKSARTVPGTAPRTRPRSPPSSASAASTKAVSSQAPSAPPPAPHPTAPPRPF